MAKPKLHWVEIKPPTFQGSEMFFLTLNYGDEVFAFITMHGAGYAAVFKSRRDGGYRTEGQAKAAARRHAKEILKSRGIEA